LLEFRFEPLVPDVMMADFKGGATGGGTGSFDCADVERVRDDRPAGAGYGARDQCFGVAGQDGSDRDRGFDAGCLECFDRSPAFVERGAMRFEDTAHIFVVGGDREADTQRGAGCGALEEIQIAEDQRPASLDHKNAVRVASHRFENARHKARLRFGGLIGIGERRAVDRLMRPQRVVKEFRGIPFESGPVTPMQPVFRVQAGLYPHGWNITIAATVCTVSSGSERMSEAGLSEKTRDGAQDGTGVCFENLKGHGSGCFQRNR
jgi:hypothetical protein